MVDNLSLAVGTLPMHMLHCLQLMRYCFWGIWTGLLKPLNILNIKTHKVFLELKFYECQIIK